MEFPLKEFNNKLMELDSEILQTQIKLRELEIEKESYINAKVLLLGENTEPPNKPAKVHKKVGPRKGYMQKIIEALQKVEKRPYKIKEIMDLGRFKKGQFKTIGIALAQEVNKDNSHLTRTEPGVYGLKEFEHLFRRDDLLSQL